MKIALGVLLAAALALTWGLVAETTKNGQLQGQVTELTSKLGDKTARDNLELQEKCATQAEKVFRQEDKELRQPQLGVPVSVMYHAHTSHYHAKLNKCFILTEYLSSLGGTDTSLTVSNLFDAYEQRTYATYTFVPDKVKKYWEVPPKVCTLIPSSAETTTCKSKEEFDAFVARYME